MRSQELHQAASVLIRAFRQDPLWSALLKDESPDCWHTVFLIPLNYCLRYGSVRAPSPALEGVIGWVTGDKADMTLWRLLQSGTAFAGVRLGVRVARRMGTVFQDVSSERRANTLGSPYNYLMVLGVDPQLQGRGFGGRLLRALINESERQGVNIYLETETRANVDMYQHFGFRVVRQILLPVVGLPMWTMIRNPTLSPQATQIG